MNILFRWPLETVSLPSRYLQGRILGFFFRGGRPPGVTKWAPKRRKSEKEKKRERKGKERNRKERGTRKRRKWIERSFNMAKGAPFKRKQGLQGKKLQGRQIDGMVEGGGGWGDIPQLCSRASKLLTKRRPPVFAPDFVGRTFLCVHALGITHLLNILFSFQSAQLS